MLETLCLEGHLNVPKKYNQYLNWGIDVRIVHVSLYQGKIHNNHDMCLFGKYALSYIVSKFHDYELFLIL